VIPPLIWEEIINSSRYGRIRRRETKHRDSDKGSENLPCDDHGRPFGVGEPQLNASLDTALTNRPGIVDKALARFDAGGQRASDGILEGFNNRGLTCEIVRWTCVK
jgi:hypothetical protein